MRHGPDSTERVCRAGPGRFQPCVSDFKPGLEGVVAVETEIAEPDREGGSLRYRGVDIEELVGHYPYERVWGLLVDNDLDSAMPDPEPYEPAALTGNAPVRPPGRDRAAVGRLEARQAERDLRRAGARRPRPALGADDGDRRPLGARRRRPHRRRPGRRRRRRARPPPRSSCSAGAARPTRGTSRRSTRTGSAPPSTASTPRRSPRASSPRPAPTAARRSRRPSARSPGRCTAARPRTSSRCSRRSPRSGDPEAGSRTTLDAGQADHGLRPPRSTAPRTRARGSSRRRRRSSARRRSRSPRSSRQAALEELQQRHPERPLATNVEYYSAVVLDVAEIPPPLAPAMFACSRVAGWSAHILEQKRTGRLFRPSARYVGPAPRSLTAARRPDARRRQRPQADALAEAGDERELADLRREWEDEVEGARAQRRLPRARGRLPRDRAVPLPPEDRAARGAGSTTRARPAAARR